MTRGTETAVRAAFARQAEFCRQLGSPFTALLCEVLGRNLDRTNEVGRGVLDWRGAPDESGDALPLRLVGGLNALVLSGAQPDLAALYPPHPLPAPEILWKALAATLVAAEADLLRWIAGPPQTNEVARSGVLMAGLLVIAARTGLPLDLFELGASAGLNLILDRYGYRLGSLACGTPGSSLTLAPVWDGDDPPASALRIARRRGVDRNPLDAGDAADRERLLAYVWPDQPERVARIRAALAIAAEDPPALDRADAADWIEQRLVCDPEPGTARVVMHSIAFQYFPAETAARITRHLAAVGAATTPEAPLAWLRYESDPALGHATLRLRLWPGGGDELLASADPHGRRVTWQARPVDAP